MERPLRIVVVGPVDERLVGETRQLPLHPEVRPLGSLLADSEALLRFQPDVVLIGLPDEPAEELGALRFLRQTNPALGVVVVTSAAREVVHAPLAARVSALLLVWPDAPGQLAAILEQARLHSDRPRADVFVDLTRGLADEINNPLMFVSGHLQLLRASFEGQPERDRRDQVAAALAGVARIEGSIERLRLLSQAAKGPRGRDDVELGALLVDALSQPRPETPARVDAAAGAHVVRGDREQLTAAVAAIVRFADDLAAAGADSELRLEGGEQARCLRIVARGNVLMSWQLPHTFEPYYPSRALRGQSPGLGLFLAQTVVLAHRGQATVRRLPDGALQVEFVLPA